MKRSGVGVLISCLLPAMFVSGCAFGPAITAGPPTQGQTPCAPQLQAQYRVQPTATQPVTAADTDVIRSIMQNRLNAFGLAGTSVVADPERVLVRLPAQLDSGSIAQVRHLISQTGRAQFIPVPAGRMDVVVGQPIPKDLLTDPGQLFSGDQLSAADPSVDQTGNPAMTLELKEAARAIFADYTTNHVGTTVAMVLDGIVRSAPSIRAPITDGKLQMVGGFTQQEVMELVTILKYGAFPLDVTEVSFGAGPTCAASVRSSGGG